MTEVQKRLSGMSDEEMSAHVVKNWLSQNPTQHIENLLWNRVLSRRGLILQLWRNPTDLHFTFTRLKEDSTTLDLRFYPTVVFADELKVLFDNREEIWNEFEKFKKEESK